METTLYPGYELVRPWRRATFIALAIAVAELLVLVALALHVAARPGVRPSVAGARRAAEVSKRSERPAAESGSLARVLPPQRVRIVVLNGNGVNGAAARAASALHRLGYPIAEVANASEQNYPTSLVLYRRGFRPEGLRLARELHVSIVSPLDGRAGSLVKGDLTVILGKP